MVVQPKVAVFIKNGIVESVKTNANIEIEVFDLDTSEGFEPGDRMAEPKKVFTGMPSNAYVYSGLKPEIRTTIEMARLFNTITKLG